MYCLYRKQTNSMHLRQGPAVLAKVDSDLKKNIDGKDGILQNLALFTNQRQIIFHEIELFLQFTSFFCLREKFREIQFHKIFASDSSDQECNLFQIRQVFQSQKSSRSSDTHIYSLTFREKKVLCNCALSLCYALFQTLIALKRVLFAIEFFPV